MTLFPRTARRPAVFGAALVLCAMLYSGPVRVQTATGNAPTARADLVVAYGDLVDRLVVTHTGQTVGEVLELLALPSEDPRRVGQNDDGLLAVVGPFLEPYAFVMADALEAVDPASGEKTFIEVATLYPQGEPQPAWVDLFRTRRYMLFSDGAGRLRAFLPGPDIRTAWRLAYPVLRLALAGERRRLGPDQSLTVEAYAFTHDRVGSRFLLHRPGTRIALDEVPSPPDRPPLDVAGWDRFLRSGLHLEGARLEPEGTVTLIGSPGETVPTLNGQPLELADLAVAFRAVFHGEGGNAFMSLDRSDYPEWAVVNYGGRLRDTRIGLVSLLCDIRFKTFSQGFDYLSGEDVRDRIREIVPEFQSHMERFAAAASEGVRSQQTRLWFYPDSVRLHVSPAGDLFMVRQARMAAAAERAASHSGEGLGEPPWTRATTGEINADYDALGRLFPEMRELDTVARLLSLFTWLREVRDEGRLLPDLDALLAVDLPPLRTPRGLPQLVVFSALDRASEAPLFLTADRSRVAERMLRLRGSAVGDVPTDLRLALGLEDLPARLPEQIEARQRFVTAAEETSGELERRRLAYEVERFLMHNRSLYGVDREVAESVVAREKAGAILNVFSTAIGGLDLDMSSAVRSAWRRAGEGPGEEPPLRRVVKPPPEGWGDSLAGLAFSPLPRHGAEAATTTPGLAGDVIVHRTGTGEVREQRDEAGRLDWRRTRAYPHGPEERVREIRPPRDGRPPAFLRFENGRSLRYTLRPDGRGLRAVPAAGPAKPEGLQNLAAAVATGGGLWEVLPSEYPLAAAEPGDPPVALLGEPAGSAAGWTAVIGGAADPLRGADALAALDEATGRAIRIESEGGLRFAHAALDPQGRHLVLRLGSTRTTVPLAEARGLLLGDGQATPTLDAALDAAAARHLVLYRDGAMTRPGWLGPALRRRPEEDPVRLMASLNERDGAKRRVSMTTAPGTAVAWSPPRVGAADITVLLRPERWPETRRQSLVAAGRRLAEAGVRVAGEPPPETGRLLVVVGGESSAALGARLTALGRRGVLRGRTLVLLPLHDPVHPGLADSLLRDHGAEAVYLTAEAQDPEAVALWLGGIADLLGNSPEADLDPWSLVRRGVERARAVGGISPRAAVEIGRILRGGFSL